MYSLQYAYFCLSYNIYSFNIYVISSFISPNFHNLLKKLSLFFPFYRRGNEVQKDCISPKVTKWILAFTARALSHLVLQSDNMDLSGFQIFTGESLRNHRDSERPETFLRNQIPFKSTVLILPRGPHMKNATLTYENHLDSVMCQTLSR